MADHSFYPSQGCGNYRLKPRLLSREASTPLLESNLQVVMADTVSIPHQGCGNYWLKPRLLSRGEVDLGLRYRLRRPDIPAAMEM